MSNNKFETTLDKQIYDSKLQPIVSLISVIFKNKLLYKLQKKNMYSSLYTLQDYII